MMWYKLGQKDVSDLEDFILPRETLAASLTSRLKDHNRLKLPPRRELTLLACSQQKIQPIAGIIALFTDGFCFTHIDSPTLVKLDSLQSAILWKRGGIRTLMGTSQSINLLISVMGRSLNHHEHYFILSKEPQSPLLPVGTSMTLPIQHHPIQLPGGVKLHRSGPGDLDKLLPLQIAYEAEEVALPGQAIAPTFTRHYLKQTLQKHIVFHLSLNGKIIAKASSNAIGINVIQVGGVFTKPEFRGQGYGSLIMQAMIAEIHSRNKIVSLFVKKHNTAARKLYDGLSFVSQEEFSIVYYNRS